jgi:type I restriction enzyme S subunit
LQTGPLADALIDALEQLIAKKQAIKSATMQQLLTGKIRLPLAAGA